MPPEAQSPPVATEDYLGVAEGLWEAISTEEVIPGSRLGGLDTVNGVRIVKAVLKPEFLEAYFPSKFLLIERQTNPNTVGYLLVDFKYKVIYETPPMGSRLVSRSLADYWEQPVLDRIKPFNDFLEEVLIIMKMDGTQARPFDQIEGVSEESAMAWLTQLHQELQSQAG